MERQFNACQTPRSMYLSIFNSFRVIRCLSQCVSPKIAIFTNIFVSPGSPPDASGAIRCMCHLTITVSAIERDIVWKSSIFHTPFYSTSPLEGFPSEYRHPVWCGKTRKVWLPDGEKKSFWHDPRTWQTYRQTDTAWRHRPSLCIASRGNKN